MTGSTVVVPLDGSSLGELAMPFATRIAGGSRSELLLASVTDSTSYTARLELLDYLEVVAERVRRSDVCVRTSLLTGTLIAETLLEALASESIQMVVGVAHRGTRSGRGRHGSVIDPLLMHARVPLLLVPENYGETWPTDRKLRVLVPLDGSPASEVVLERAVALAGWIGAELLVLEVIDPAVDGLLIEDPMLQLQREQAYVEDIVGRLKWNGTEVSGCVELGRPARTINRIAHTSRVDLIAMAIHGWGGSGQKIPGRVASAVLEESHVPLLVAGNAVTEATAPRPPTWMSSAGGPSSL